MKFNLKDFFGSKSRELKIVVGILGGIIVALMILQAGIFVGYRKAAFSYRLGDNYYQTFNGHRGNLMMGFPQDGSLPNSHGAIGKIVKIELPNFVVVDVAGVEKTILIESDTAIRKFRNEIKPNDLKVDDYVAVIGSPNDQSQIEARFIRVMPPPQSN